ncbi:MAG: S-layer homology domain-containing protein [Oscillospiraceae bacterium]|jgi:hypothetical protein|nr:S-layer homology domain-containing protein [Oscillospiraceae bacterium]
MKRRILSRCAAAVIAAALTIGLFLPAPRAAASYSEGSYLVGRDIPAGLYYVEATKGLGFCRLNSDASGSFSSLLATGTFYTWTFIEVLAGEYLYLEHAAATPASEISPINLCCEGMYRVGYDIPPGEYTLQSTGSYQAYAAVLSGTRGASRIVTNSLFTGQCVLSAQSGQLLELSDAEIIGIKAEPQVPGLTFIDVFPTDWFVTVGAVKFVIDRGLMSGLSSEIFAPNSPMTRAMLVTVLHSYAKRPAPTAPNPFSDIPDGTWYTNAVTWAAENGVVSGTGGGQFSPDANITREQLALILYKYRGSPAVPAGALPFADGQSVSSWAADAVKWCAISGIVSGKSDNMFDPQAGATRAEVATMLMRFVRLAE